MISFLSGLKDINHLFDQSPSSCRSWDNCGVSNSCKLERLQLEAARIITGLPIFTNTEYLYRETGWERLEERRTRIKLQLLYNIQNGSTPSYLHDLIPPTIQSTTIYPLRNGNDIIVPFCRLSLTRDSFVSANLHELETPQLSQTSHTYSNIGRM
jgi:hypothetical protein